MPVLRPCSAGASHGRFVAVLSRERQALYDCSRRKEREMVAQMLEGSTPVHLTLDELDALIAASQKQLAGVNKLLKDR